MPIYKGAAKRLDDIDLPKIGAEIGVGEDVIHALIEVETRGTGFDKQDRVIILFEPHKFYKHLKGAKRERAVAEGLAYPKWGMKKYPKDSYPRLEAAMEIDETAALMSCSWGMGQIMGENFRMLDYNSVQDMVAAFADDEEAHLKGMIDFIKEAGIADDLLRIQKKTEREQRVTAADWVPVVRVYNGAGYEKNNYHTRAVTAYNRWLKIKDTPLASALKVIERAALEEAENEVEVGQTSLPETPSTSQVDANETVTEPAAPKPDNPIAQEITLSPVTAEDKTSSKSLKATAGGLGAAGLAWLSANVGEALGYIKGLDLNLLFKWLIIFGSIVLALYIIRQIIGKVIAEVGTILYNLKAMQYHANPSTNNVKLSSPAPKEPVGLDFGSK